MLKLYNAQILMPDFTIINGKLGIDNSGLISYINKIPQDISFSDEINLNGNLIIPGFNNAHTHSPMTFLRSYAEDLPLNRWLNEKIFPAEDKLTKEDAYYCTILAIMEYLTSGITSCYDMYFFPDAVANACVDTGFRCVLSATLNNFKESIDILHRNYVKYNNFNPLINYRLGFHAEYTTNRPLLEQLANLSHSLNAPVSAHACETIKEVNECIERYGKTPIQLFDSLGLMDIECGAYHHCVWLNNDDIKLLKKHNFSVVTNGGSNCKLASGIADLEKLLNNDINIALGTDGPASNNCLDMFREMWLATALQKQKTKDASSISAESVLKMATINGAVAMGLKNVGAIAIGNKADLAVIDLKRPNMQPTNNIVKNLVFSGSKENVLMTIVNGKILYHRDNGFNIGISPDIVYKKVNAVIKRISE